MTSHTSPEPDHARRQPAGTGSPERTGTPPGVRDAVVEAGTEAASGQPGDPAASAGTDALLTLVGVPVAVVGGSLMSVQSRLNGALSHSLADPYLASVVSFGTGLVLVVLASVLMPRGRQGMSTLVRRLRTRWLNWWYTLAGLFGAVLVIAQTVTVQLLGVSVFILGIVVGQSLGGLLVDRFGWGPGGVKHFTGYRLLGTAVIVVAVVVAMLPRFAAGGVHVPLPVVVLMALMPVLAGVGNSVQTAWNAHVASAT